MKVIYGRGAITEYWVQRFAELPAGELQELQMYGDESLFRIEHPTRLSKRRCTSAVMARLLEVFAVP